jgi:hypothetical protein
MYLLLVLVGVALAVAGVAMVRYALPIEEMPSVALFVSGIVALVGALVIGALAAVARSLSRIAERLEIQPLPLPPVAAVSREDPAPRPARVPATAARGGSARASLLGWLGRASAPTPMRAPPPAATPAAATAPTPVDLAPLTRVAEPTVAAPPPPPVPVVRTPTKPAPAQNGAANTVYRSGVIDGMAYTLFMDGSIQAELPQGTVKFGNIDDLQKYLLGNR